MENNILYNNDLVVEASPELVPTIRIAPLDISKMRAGKQSCNLHIALQTNKSISLHKKARNAIEAAITDLGLQKDDVITILTTTGNYYVSGCVTKVIETICQWNREVTSSTKAILVIHEFGYPYKGLKLLKEKYKLPIIEDCAYAFFTEDKDIGKVGDYVICSLTKAFNMQMGGLILSSKEIPDGISQLEEAYIVSHLSNELKQRKTIIEKRLLNYHYLCAALKPIGIEPFFEEKEGIVPGVFLFRWKNNIDYPDLKQYMQRNGIESSVFYNENAFYIPVHQNLSRRELDYMVNLLKYYNDTQIK